MSTDVREMAVTAGTPTKWVEIVAYDKMKNVSQRAEIVDAFARAFPLLRVADVFTESGDLFVTETYVEAKDAENVCAIYRVVERDQQSMSFALVLPRPDSWGFYDEEESSELPPLEEAC